MRLPDNTLREGMLSDFDVNLAGVVVKRRRVKIEEPVLIKKEVKKPVIKLLTVKKEKRKYGDTNTPMSFGQKRFKFNVGKNVWESSVLHEKAVDYPKLIAFAEYLGVMSTDEAKDIPFLELRGILAKELKLKFCP